MKAYVKLPGAFKFEGKNNLDEGGQKQNQEVDMSEIQCHACKETIIKMFAHEHTCVFKCPAFSFSNFSHEDCKFPYNTEAEL